MSHRSENVNAHAAIHLVTLQWERDRECIQLTCVSSLSYLFFQVRLRPIVPAESCAQKDAESQITQIETNIVRSDD